MKAVWSEILSQITGKQKIAFLAIVAGLSIFVYYVASFDRYPQDNPIEEVLEETIKQETGADVDLSPDSEEKPKDDL